MDVAGVYQELYGRIGPLAERAVIGLSADQLAHSPEPGTNTIGWLIWHLTRVQDHHVAELLDTEQLWLGDDWADRFGVEPDPDNIGYGHSREQMEAIRPNGPGLLLDYFAAVMAHTDEKLLSSLTPDALDRIVDRRWDPPVSLGVRLVSVADDSLQHVGQACYLRGLFGW